MRAGDEGSRIARLIGPGGFDLTTRTLDPPAPGQVRVRILTTGVCASELHTVMDAQGSYPLSIGHEPTGIVAAVGEGVEGFSPGMRVTGGFGPAFADDVVADHGHLVRVPDEVGPDDANGEPLGCVMEARRRTHVEPGDRIALVGAGYMGLLMLQILMVTGAGEVTIVEPRGDARRNALAFGAADALAPDTVRPDLDGTFDVVIEATGTQRGLDLATGLVREHGILSILGYHQSDRTVDMQQWNWKAIDVVNAHVRRRDLLNDAIRRGLELTRLGRIHPGSLVTHRFGLDAVGDAFAALAGKPEGFVKAVVTMEGGAT
jgi:threonine dehydrogenase-like Zn-dependent dehydrogenase